MSSPNDPVQILKPQIKVFGLCLLLYFLGLFGVGFWLPVTGLIAYVSWVTLHHHLKSQRSHQDETEDEEEETTEEDYSPGWMNHPNMERTEWLNNIVLKIWSKTEASVKQKIIELCEGELVASYLQRLGGGSLAVSEFKLGEIPPRLGGVRIQGVSLDELILDSDFAYIGTSTINISVTLTKFPQKLALTVQDFTMSGKFRIVCKPLLNNKPFVGGIKFSFLDIPEFDFVPSGFLAITDLPGLRHLIHSQVIGLIQESLMFPKGVYFSVPKEEEVDKETRDPVSIPLGVFSLSLVEAKDLKNTDFSLMKKDVSDPYAEISFSVDGFLYEQQTQTIKNNLNPQWNYHKVVYVDKPETFTDITINIFDKDKFTKDDFLGECIVYKDVINGVVLRQTTYDYWKILEKTDRGSVRVRVSWSKLGLAPPRNIDDQALVAVFVDSGKNIRSEESSKPDTKIRLSIGSQSSCTKTILNSKTPMYEERLVLFSENPSNDDLFIELIDDKDDTVLGSATLELTQVLGQADLLLTDLEINLNSPSVPRMKLRLSLALRFLQSGPISFNLNPPVTKAKESFPTTSSSAITNVISSNSEVTNGEYSSLHNNISESLEDDLSVDQEEYPESVATSQSERDMRRREVKPPEGSQPFRRSNTLPVLKTAGVNGVARQYSLRKRLANLDVKAKVLITLKYNKTTSVLSLVVHKATNLQEVSILPIPSPYVKTYIVESNFGTNRRDIYSKKKTKIKKNSVNPVFEETLEYFVPLPSLRSSKIELIVSSRRSVLRRSVLLGRCLVSLVDLAHQPSITLWNTIRWSDGGGRLESSTSLNGPSTSARRTSQSSLPASIKVPQHT